MIKKIAQRNCTIGDRHLPWPDHLVTRAHAANTAITNGDQKVFCGHRWMRQNTQTRFMQRDFRGVEFGPANGSGLMGVTQHFRYVAKKYSHWHIDGFLAI